MQDLNDLVSRYSHRVTFVLVYIMEAHASDEWPISNLPEGRVINQHTQLTDRISCAESFRQELNVHEDMTVVVDDMDNIFNSEYPSWPTRCWILSEDSQVHYRSMPGDGCGDAINLQDLEVELRDLVGTDTTTRVDRALQPMVSIETE